MTYLQSQTWQRKVGITQAKIIEWYHRYDGQVCISFSGGKDSFTLLHIARRIFPDIEAAFVDTGLEYPEIREFVQTFDNVTWLHPIKYDRKKREYVRTNFKEVIEKYGYPVISKEVSECIGQARSALITGKYTYRLQKINGVLPGKNGNPSKYNLAHWKWLMDAPFKISSECCRVLKKTPMKIHIRKTGKLPMTAQMASESRLRYSQWLKNGCNGFHMKAPISNPMSFWQEQDILQYLQHYKLPLAKCYGEIIPHQDKDELTLSGCLRTGCMFCMFGCHLEKAPNRFQKMKVSHPKQYEYCIKPVEHGGLGLGDVLDFLGVDYA